MRLRTCSPIRRPLVPGPWRRDAESRPTCRSRRERAGSKRSTTNWPRTGGLASAARPQRRGRGVHNFLKGLARGLATVTVSPLLLSYLLRGALLGKNRALEGSTQTLSLIPGVLGDYLRGAFLSHTLAKCDPSVTVQFGTIFSQCGARLGANVYIGPRCHI